jgi:hypothetical protein
MLFVGLEEHYQVSRPYWPACLNLYLNWQARAASRVLIDPGIFPTSRRRLWQNLSTVRWSGAVRTRHQTIRMLESAVELKLPCTLWRWGPGLFSRRGVRPT